MQKFQDTLETRKRSFICTFSICMTVPLLSCKLWLWPLKATSLSKRVQQEFSNTHTNYFTPPRVLLTSIQNFKKIHYFWQLKG